MTIAFWTTVVAHFVIALDLILGQEADLGLMGNVGLVATAVSLVIFSIEGPKGWVGLLVAGIGIILGAEYFRYRVEMQSYSQLGLSHFQTVGFTLILLSLAGFMQKANGQALDDFTELLEKILPKEQA